MKPAVIITLLFMIMLTGCTSGDTKAAELFETARFEEQQHNLEHATKLYAEIVATYPASPKARDAAARLEQLNTRKP